MTADPTAKFEDSLRIARLTIDELARIGAPVTPQNFNIWYAHFAGDNPDLSEQITKVADEKVTYTDELSDELFERHFSNMRLGDAVMQVSGEVEKQMSDVVKVLSDTGKSTSAYGDALKGASGQLGQLTDSAALQAMVDNLVKATAAMEAHSRKLEDKLVESTKEITQLRDSVDSIRTEALSDGLTGLPNRKALDETLRAYTAESDGGLCLVMSDVDHFKKFNDTWGHQTGDQVLRLVAATLSANVKGRDMAARYGGEEFALLLPDTELTHAVRLANVIRQAVETKKLRKRSTNEDLGTITLSLGVAVHQPGEAIADLIERADKCLYAAKGAGRNRVVAETELEAIEAGAA
ncbi:MAG: GGDEF domain-containing protein [Pseudomonadota bacterium]